MLRCSVFLRVEKYLLSPRILIIKRASNKARRRRTPTQTSLAHISVQKRFSQVYMKGSSLCSVKCFRRPNQFRVSLHDLKKISIWQIFCKCLETSFKEIFELAMEYQ